MIARSAEERPSPSAAEALAELQTLLGKANAILQELSSRPLPERGGREVAAPVEAGELEAANADQAELVRRLVDVERQLGQLMNLYVATYQLHATLNPVEVQAAIGEIAINLLGAESFVLLLCTAQGDECEVALARGVDPDTAERFSGPTYRGGDPTVDATLRDGYLRVGRVEGSSALAAVPLGFEGTTVGTLVLLKLFHHKSELRPEDRELLDLLAAHAASSLFAARAFALTVDKLRTLESLVKLARKS